ncbi:MAG: DUF2807 domain-containing protein [Caldilinea sp. CFX5]|nr:DUF2807 domain-containing protein [Caldilinea sp. CFX5]
MNKRLLSIFMVMMLLFSGCALAAVRGSGNIVQENRPVSDFEQVEVCCGMQLVLTQGDDVQLTLAGDDNILPEIETIVRRGTLTVRYRTNFGRLNLRLNRPVIVNLQMPTIHGVTISGGGSLETERLETDRITFEFSGGSQGTINDLQAENANLSTSGGGEVTIDHIDLDTLNLDMSGGGRTTIAGGAITNQRISLSGGSHYDGVAVEGETATLDVSGGAAASVWAAERLVVQASGGSQVEYTGNPAIEQELSGGSELRAVNR